MVDLPDSFIALIGVGIPLLLGFFYFYSNKRDRSKFDSASIARDEDEGERDKLELARKVKKELSDEAEKVELIRKDIAKYVKEEMHEFIEQKIKDLRVEREHYTAAYEQRVETKFTLYEQATGSRFTANDLVVKNLMDKIIDTAKIQADALVKINESLDYLRKLLYEISGKVNRVEKEQDLMDDKFQKSDKGRTSR